MVMKGGGHKPLTVSVKLRETITLNCQEQGNEDVTKDTKNTKTLPCLKPSNITA